MGHATAGNVLQYVPYYLSPRPSFEQVRDGFVVRASQLYPADGPDAGTGSDVGEAAHRAFSGVGLTGTRVIGGICTSCLP